MAQYNTYSATFGYKSRLIGIAVLTLSIFTGISLANQNQNIEEKASVSDGVASIWIEPSSGNYKSGEKITSSVFFTTGNTAISGVAFRLIYKYTGTDGNLSAEGIDITENILSGGNWVCPTQVANFQGNELIVDIACANTSSTGFSDTGNVKLADISVVAYLTQESPELLTVFFDPSLSVMTKNPDNSDILATPTTTGSYIITNSEIADIPSKRDCEIKFTPATLVFPSGQSMTLKAEVIGSKATNLSFTTNNIEFASVSPGTDRKSPYETKVTTYPNFALNDIALITADAYLGKNKICTGTAVVKPLP